MSIEAQKAKVRELRYTAGLFINAAGPALGVALLEGGASKWIAVLVAAAGVVTGSAQLGVAANKTKKQRADGMFDPVPESGPLPSPIDLVVDNLPAIVGAVNSAQAEVESRLADLDKVRQVAVDALGPLGPVAQQTVQTVADAGLSAVQKAIRDFGATTR